MTHIISKEGYVFAKNDKSAVYGRNLYLSALDSPTNYVEITESEGEELNKALEQIALEEAGR